MIWNTPDCLPAFPAGDEVASEDVLMHFTERDCYCIGWYDHSQGDWYIWKGMDDSTALDGEPDFWAPLTKP